MAATPSRPSVRCWRSAKPTGQAGSGHRTSRESEPEELLYDEIEAIWADIAERDDWGPFEAKLAAIESARLAWGLDI